MVDNSPAMSWCSMISRTIKLWWVISAIVMTSGTAGVYEVDEFCGVDVDSCMPPEPWQHINSGSEWYWCKKMNFLRSTCLWWAWFTVQAVSLIRQSLWYHLSWHIYYLILVFTFAVVTQSVKIQIKSFQLHVIITRNSGCAANVTPHLIKPQSLLPTVSHTSRQQLMSRSQKWHVPTDSVSRVRHPSFWFSQWHTHPNN